MTSSMGLSPSSAGSQDHSQTVTHIYTHLLLLSVVSSRAESLPLPEEELCELR